MRLEFRMKWIIFELFILVKLSFSLAPNDLLILILSQPDTFHAELARNLQTNISKQSSQLNNNSIPINIQILHEIIDHPGYWAFLPILPYLESLGHIKSNIKWIVLCEDRSSVNVNKLLTGLSELDWKQDFYVGYPMRDREATIIHHFAFFENPQWFPYPLIRSGMAFTSSIIKRLTKRVQEDKPTSEFFIDASHELSLFIWQNIMTTKPTMTTTSTSTTMQNNKPKSRPVISLKQSSSQQQENESGEEDANGKDAMRCASVTETLGNDREGTTTDCTKLSKTNGHKLLMAPSPYFCRIKQHGEDNCAIYADETQATCDRVDVEEIYFAIKTYHKFHSERIPIIERTWGKFTVHKKFFSDVADDTIPTFTTNVPNTETGHCTKTLSIFRLALKDIDEWNAARTTRRHQKLIKWIFLCDDDTLLSVSRICDILGCFNNTKYIYLGERYGYRLHSKDGFNYITGGGGMAISLPTARKIVTSCVCPSISSPDDMIIGMCLQRLGIRATHSSKFHQARPTDYTAELLSLDEPVSFHKFWQIDPLRTYAKWFQLVDQQKCTRATKSNNKSLCDIQTSSSQSTNFVKQSTNGGGGGGNHRRTHHVDL